MPNMIERVLLSSTVYTDEAPMYNPLANMGYEHKRVHHAQKIYVEGDAHTNTLEGFWSLVKRCIGGVYHSVSDKHLQAYLSEYAWRYNHRNDGHSSFRTLILRAARP